MRLDERLQKIEDTIENRIKDHDFEPKIRSFVFGDRARIGDVTPPAIWIFTDTSPINTVSGYAEEWTLQLVLAATFKGQDINKVKQTAESLAIQGTSVLLKDRTLDCNVRDLTRTSWLPGTTRIEDHDKIYGAGFEMEAKFRNKIVT